MSLIKSYLYLFLGILSGILPIGIFDLVFISKGVDTGYVGGIILDIIAASIITGFCIFLDLLIVRFLFKKKLSNMIYFLIGVVVGISISSALLILQ